LLTVDFSRGTDFKLNAKDADKHPGLHVICAFIPNSFSDYLQVVGRTGRQGKNGSVSLYFVDFTLTESLVT
jgi:superfamily II DNA helicase RecQ